MTEFYDFELGSFEAAFTLPALNNADWVQLATDTAAATADADLTAPGSALRLAKITDGYRLTLHRTDGTEIDRFECEHPGAAEVRLAAHNDALSVFLDDRFVHTFFPKYVHYETEPGMIFSASKSLTITDALVTELFDCRDKLEVDLQSSLANAISSVIGQKPIKAWATYDGAVCYAYDPPADDISVYRASSFERRRSLPQNAASDVMVMHQRLAVLTDVAALAQFGFMTRLVRFPELGSGAVRVGLHLLDSARRSAVHYTASGPIDPRVEMYDRITAWVLTPGASVGYEVEFIVEGLAFTGGTRPSMRLEGGME